MSENSYMLRKHIGGRCIEDIEQVVFSLISDLKNLSPLEGPPKEVVERAYELQKRAMTLTQDLDSFVDWYNARRNDGELGN